MHYASALPHSHKVHMQLTYLKYWKQVLTSSTGILQLTTHNAFELKKCLGEARRAAAKPFRDATAEITVNLVTNCTPQLVILERKQES